MKLDVALLGSPCFANHVMSLKETTQYFSSSQGKCHQTAVTYCKFVSTMSPNKSEIYRVRMTVGGDRLDAYQDVHSLVVGTMDAKLHINSTISDAHKEARYCTADIKDFFLCSTVQVYQYMRIHQHYIPPEVLDEYLTSEHFDSKGFAYLEIRMACMDSRKLPSLPMISLRII